MKKVSVILMILFFDFNFIQAWIWVYPEHREIAIRAAEKLSPDKKELL